MHILASRSKFIESVPKSDIDAWLASLDERSRFVAERRFGLNGHEKHALKELGQMLEGVGVTSFVSPLHRKPGNSGDPGMGVTRERVRQIEAKSIRQLIRSLEQKAA